MRFSYFALVTTLICIVVSPAFSAGINSCYTETFQSVTNGRLITRKNKYFQPNCPEPGSAGSMCICADKEIEYFCDCDSGWYATNTRPSTATCTCKACPANSTCSSYTNFSCNRGYYKSGGSCARCPKDSNTGTYGTTSGSGSTSISSCYIPANGSYSNTYGNFTYTSNCYY